MYLLLLIKFKVVNDTAIIKNLTGILGVNGKDVSFAVEDFSTDQGNEKVFQVEVVNQKISLSL